MPRCGCDPWIWNTSFLVAAEVAEHPDQCGVWRRIAVLKDRGDRVAWRPGAGGVHHIVNLVTDPLPFSTSANDVGGAGQGRMLWDAVEGGAAVSKRMRPWWFFWTRWAGIIGRSGAGIRSMRGDLLSGDILSC